MRFISYLRSLCFAAVLVVISTSAFAQIGISVEFGPPALPVYEQPLCPGDGYLWTPGYWAYGEDDYYWVPGTWVEAPEVGYLWTPPYWGWGGNGYLFHEGYWGQQVGFYGGISYGYGYFGRGYEGGRWDHDHFFYNRTVNNVNITNIHNTYNTTIINNNSNNHVSYNGGNGGIEMRPTREEENAGNGRHVQAVAAQRQHEQAARGNPELRAAANQGKPPIAATGRPGDFRGSVVPAKEAGAPYHPADRRAADRPVNAPAARPENNVPRPPSATHARDLTPHAAPTPRDTGNAKLDQRFQQQQQKLYTQQNQDHQKLQQKQEQDHQRQTQQIARPARDQQAEQKRQQQSQQVEQRHEQQTQQLEQRHQQQSQRVDQRQAQQQQRQQARPPNRNEPRPGGGGGHNR